MDTNVMPYTFSGIPGSFVSLKELAQAVSLKTSELIDRFGALEASGKEPSLRVVSRRQFMVMSIHDILVVARFFEDLGETIPDFFVTQSWAEAVRGCFEKGYKRIALEQHYVEPLDEDDPNDEYRLNTSDPKTDWLKSWKATDRSENWWWAIVAYKE